MSGLRHKERGLRLLKKGRRGLLRAIFSRAGLLLLLVVLQALLLVFLFGRLRAYLPHYVTFSTAFSALMALYLLNSRHDPSAKLTWIVVIMLFPAVGALLYLYTQGDVGHRMLRDRYLALSEATRGRLPQNEEAAARFEAEAPDAAGLVRYVNRTGCYPLYAGCDCRYFPLGDALFPVLLEELEKAERFIFLEFFVVDEGVMWGSVLEILARKASEGVTVRLLYDGTNEFFTLPRDYPKRLALLGIECRTFAPIAPFISTHYNYRDHRKLLVVDGKVAFTGGVNLADEYINEIKRFGHWKDTGLLLRGAAAQSFTLMFLQMWNLSEKEPDFSAFLDVPPEAVSGARGFVLPYADCPLDEERVGEWVYMDILNRAQRYVYIMTPYLILDGEMETALRFAAERGVDVRLILPGIPDKKLPYALAKTHYAALLRSGVRIFEYVPGFVHAKVFLSDEREAVVGTINLDYRSLYHHFECAAWLRGVDCLADVKADFLDTLSYCREITPERLKREKWSVKLAGFVMKIIAPLV